MRQDYFVVAQHSSEGRLILAVCDKEVHGKKLEDKRAALDLSSKFYSGGEKNKDAVVELMRKAYTIHAVGKNSVAVAIKLGLATKDNVKTVAGVPHVQVLVL
ncbi:DUF424 family protein [Candidatus Woesearchaeota archaeon]|nr:DUF424 family protein [Candidatus Woesearchaeota archaeon]